MAETIRAFIALDLPKSVADAIARVQAQLRTYDFKVSWVRSTNIHLTLKFLGDIAPAAVEDVGRALRQASRSLAGIGLQAKGVGVFPGIKRPKVIWVGVAGDLEVLVRLQQALDDQLAASGFAKEDRPFKGHLTLGRVKGHIDPRRLMDALAQFAQFESEAFVVDKIRLYQSELKPTGAVYTPLITVALADH